MAQSTTDWLQTSRLTVVEVDGGARRLRVKADAEACSDITCAAEAVVVTDDGQVAGLEALYPGDIVKLESGARDPQRIVVLRRVWDELTSPEF